MHPPRSGARKGYRWKALDESYPNECLIVPIGGRLGREYNKRGGAPTSNAALIGYAIKGNSERSTFVLPTAVVKKSSFVRIAMHFLKQSKSLREFQRFSCISLSCLLRSRILSSSAPAAVLLIRATEACPTIDSAPPMSASQYFRFEASWEEK